MVGGYKSRIKKIKILLGWLVIVINPVGLSNNVQ